MPITTKFVLNGGSDVRRLRLDPTALTYDELTRAARGVASNGDSGGGFALSFQDDENDTIAIRNDADWREALRVAHDEGRKSLKVFITATTSNTTSDTAPTPTPQATAATAAAAVAGTPAPASNPVPAPVKRMAKSVFHLTTSMVFLAIFAPIAISLLFGLIKSIFGIVGCVTCAFFRLIPLVIICCAFRKISRISSAGNAGNSTNSISSMPCMVPCTMWKRRMKSGRCGRFRWNWASDSNDSPAVSSSSSTVPANPWASFSAPSAPAASASPAASAAPAADGPSTSTPGISADSIKRIVAMGFHESDARAAIAYHGSVPRALDALLGQVQ